MSAFDRFRTPGGDLASFFRSLVTPAHRYSSSSPAASLSGDWEWEQYRAKQGGSKRLDFFDHDLYGARGAEVVLDALKQNPGATSITLSSNELGDNGVRALLAGLKQLRAQGVGGNLQELNLSGNGLTDVSLHLLALHLLLPSPAPPTLTHLYLTANKFTFTSPELTDFLGSALSSPQSAVQCLSFTNNPEIGSKGLKALLSRINLGVGTQLAQLHFSICGLMPDCAEPIAEWLEDPRRGARLQVLCINGNAVSPAGVRRVTRAVSSGLASGLLHLECLANDAPTEDERFASVIQQLESQETQEDLREWTIRLDSAKERNKSVLKETRLAALGLLAHGRVLFGGNPHELEDEDEDEDTDTSAQRMNGLKRNPADVKPFPFLRLPIELQVHVLRCCLLLQPSHHAHLYQPARKEVEPPPPRPSRPTTVITSNDGVLSSPLTEAQFLAVLAHCASPATLATEIRLATLGSQVPSLLKEEHGRFANESWTSTTSGVKHSAWEEYFLRSTGCDRFARG